MKTLTRKLIRRRSPSGNKAPEIASKNCNTWLYAEDLAEVLRMVGAKGSNESAIIREIVHEWMRLKKKKVLAVEAATSPEQVRSLVEDAIARQLSPLREKQAAIGEGIGELLAKTAGLKEHFQAPKSSENAARQPTLPPEVLGLLTRLVGELNAARQDILATRSEVGEAVGAQIQQLAHLLEGSQAQYTLLGQSFICNWTTLDFVVRLVETGLRGQRVEPDRIESETSQEREHLRDYGLEIIRAMEQEMGLPVELRLKMIAPLIPATT